MAKPGPLRRLHHDLRAALSAVHMNIQTLEAVEAGDQDLDPEKRLAILCRARDSLAEAVAITDRLRALDRQPD